MANTQTHEYKVAMTCEGCSNAVQRVLNKLKDQIEDININLDNKTVKVKTSLTSDEILETIKKTGKEVEYVSSS